MLAHAEPGAVLVLSNADWFAVRAERAPSVDDHGAKGLIFRGRQVYVGGETRLMGAAEAAEWGIRQV
ncbi:hypothetical protein E4M02_02690 [Brevundimonas sp. S30B]|nr:hypothetical protein E4M02_02690 [Brevundimonas sp. S30B]